MYRIHCTQSGEVKLKISIRKYLFKKGFVFLLKTQFLILSEFEYF